MQVTKLSFRIILGISVVLISALSIQEIDIKSSISLSDKLLHLFCFLYLTIISWLSRIIYKELWLYVIVLAYGILIEIVQIYIPYRSFEFLDIFAECQKKGGIAAFIDAEHAFDRFYAENLGVDIENLIISQPDHGEQALEITENLIRSGAIDMVIIDSVAALTPKSEIEGEMGDSKMGLHARLMSQALRKLTGIVSKTNCTVFFINQLREKIGIMFGNPETTTGGNALKFYASVRIDIRRSTQIKNSDGGVIGNRTRVKIVKNKVAPPFKLAEFDIMYGKGISKVGEIIDLAVNAEIISKSGSWFSYEGTKLGQGRDAVKTLLTDNPELMDKIEKQIKELID